MLRTHIFRTEDKKRPTTITIINNVQEVYCTTELKWENGLLREKGI